MCFWREAPACVTGWRSERGTGWAVKNVVCVDYREGLVSVRLDDNIVDGCQTSKDPRDPVKMLGFILHTKESIFTTCLVQKNCTKKIFMTQIHDGVITHLEPDSLKCKVKWALESIITNKASGGDGIPVELFQSWKMLLWTCCTQYASKFGKLSSGHRTGKGQFSFQSQRKAMPKHAQTTAQLHSSHMLVK